MKTIANTPLPSAVRQPDYDRRALRSRIVHLGFGAFHRAHQALLTDRLLSAQGGDWGICEISLSGGVPLFEALRQQDHLYSVLEKGADGHQAIVVGAVHESLHRKLEGITAVLEKLAEPQVAIVSMTITEKAIASSPAAGGWIDSIRGSSPIWRGRISRRPCPAFWWKRCGCGANAACPPSPCSPVTIFRRTATCCAGRCSIWRRRGIRRSPTGSPPPPPSLHHGGSHRAGRHAGHAG